MADEALTKYAFLPFIRQGIGQLIDSSQNTFRASIDIKLKINNGQEVKNNISFVSPGDIVGIDPRFIVKTFPQHNIGDFEPNYFPYVDFWGDFPWRYTPVKNNKGQLPPWLCLIVLRAPGEENPEYEISNKGTNLLPCIKINDIKKSLPDLSQSWAWAHVQIVTGEDILTGELNNHIKEILRTEPERIVSRIMCLRRLEPKVLYHAFLVPVYESGRLAGLGWNDEEIAENLTQDGKIEYDRFSWYDTTPNNQELPYYYQWEFRTGYRGDFETLVRLLEPRELNSTIGKRPMECTHIGYDIPNIEVEKNENETDYSENDLGLEGALRTINSTSTEWPVKNGDSTFLEKFQDLLNLPAENLLIHQDVPPIITPPIYGCWHAALDKVNLENFAITWLDELNLDLRNRTYAALGTQVVQKEQENLMAAAWKQIGAIDEANRLIRLAQLGKGVTDKIYNKYLKTASSCDTLRSVSPLLSKVLIKKDKDNDSEKISIKNLIKQSKVPIAALSPTFKKIQRKGTAFYKNRQISKNTSNQDVLERLYKGEIAPAGPTPVSKHEINNISDQFAKNLKYTKGWVWKVMKKLPPILFYLAVILAIAFGLSKLFHLSLPISNAVISSIIGFVLLMALFLSRLVMKGILGENLRTENITSELVKKAMNNPPKNFKITLPGEFESESDNKLDANFGVFAFAMLNYLEYKPNAENTNSKEDTKMNKEKHTLEDIKTTILADVEPRITFVNKINSLLELNTDELPKRKDEIDLIMAAPEFNRPMYEPLRDMSQDLLLPGIEKIPQNTVGLLKTNQKFVESYLVGLNHEFARELLWREYPTDQRGSYFRQFWDVTDTLSDNETTQNNKSNVDYSNIQKLREKIKNRKNQLKDIFPIHKWRDKDLITDKYPRGLKKLGENKFRNNSEKENPNDNKENLVLLIRGDLLKKYPNALIYMAKAEWTSGNKSRKPILKDLKEDATFPIFKGTLPPDITFLGFNISDEEAKGSMEPGKEPGYYFIIEERVSEVKFGLDEFKKGDPEPLDPPQIISDYSWWHIDNAEAKTSSGYINVACQELPVVENLHWNRQSASIARITLQKPMRIAIHAEKMIPNN